MRGRAATAVRVGAVALVVGLAATTFAPAQAHLAGSDPPAGGARQSASLANSSFFNGAVEIFNCSGSLVRWADSRPSDPAMMLTNGHCYQASDKAGRRFARDVLVGVPDARDVTLIGGNGRDRGVVKAKRVLYSTSFRTDVGLYTLRRSYAELRSAFQVRARTLDDHPPSPHADVVAPSGFSREQYDCTLDGSVFRLFNDDFRWQRSLRLKAHGCHTIRGTSGTPLINPVSGKVVGINNAINVAGPSCTVSLCEETKTGLLSNHPHRRYGQQTWWLTTCEGSDHRIDLDQDGCLLPKPPAR